MTKEKTALEEFKGKTIKIGYCPICGVIIGEEKKHTNSKEMFHIAKHNEQHDLDNFTIKDGVIIDLPITTLNLFLEKASEKAKQDVVTKILDELKLECKPYDFREVSNKKLSFEEIKKIIEKQEVENDK